MPGFPGEDQGSFLGRGVLGTCVQAVMPDHPRGLRPGRLERGIFTEVVGDAQRDILPPPHPRPLFPRRWWKIGSEGKVRSKRKETAEAGAAPETLDGFGVLRRHQCASFSVRDGEEGAQIPIPSLCSDDLSPLSTPLHPPLPPQ